MRRFCPLTACLPVFHPSRRLRPAASSPGLILAAALFFASCAPAPEPHGDPIQELTWETTGGGQVKFRLAPASDDAYVIHVFERHFKPSGKDLRLTPADAAAYQVARQIFSGELDLAKETFTPRGPTGSWTSITVTTARGKTSTIKNIAPWQRLKPLSDFVNANFGE